MSAFIKLSLLFALISASLLNSAHAQATAAVELKAEARKEILTEIDGKVEAKWVELDQVVPGDTVVYIISANNVSDSAAEAVVVEDGIPENLVYLADSAAGDDTRITFSIDGTVFDSPENLTVKLENGETRLAQASDITHIRWEFNDSLLPGNTARVSFKAKVE